MKELVRLVNEWAGYAEINPDATITDFCKHFLSKSQRRRPAREKISPPDLDGHFMKVIMRLAQSYTLYARIALRDTSLGVYENFVLLAVLRAFGEAKKTEVINYAMMDISTGSDILNRLKKDGYLAERGDPADKRSKLISITAAGKRALQESFKKTFIARRLFLKGLSEEDKKLCIQILEPLEVRHSQKSIESKNKTIEEIENE